MFYITGDTHGDFSRYLGFAARVMPTEKDTVIVLGDAGLNYYCNEMDDARKAFVSEFPFTTFCIHGNHERRPATISTYQMREYCGGMVWYEEKYPNILFAKDGEIYDFDGYSCIAIGGAYSVDKHYRLARGWSWFADEQPSEEIKAYVEEQLAKRGNRIDIVFSHTCPVDYEPVEVFISGLNQAEVDGSTEKWLGKIEAEIEYRKWYCGHFHTEKKTDRIQFMFEEIEELSLPPLPSP